MLGRHARVAKWRLMIALAPPLRIRLYLRKPLSSFFPPMSLTADSSPRQHHYLDAAFNISTQSFLKLMAGALSTYIRFSHIFALSTSRIMS